MSFEQKYDKNKMQLKDSIEFELTIRGKKRQSLALLRELIHNLSNISYFNDHEKCNRNFRTNERT